MDKSDKLPPSTGVSPVHPSEKVTEEKKEKPISSAISAIHNPTLPSTPPSPLSSLMQALYAFISNCKTFSPQQKNQQGLSLLKEVKKTLPSLSINQPLEQKLLNLETRIEAQLQLHPKDDLSLQEDLSSFLQEVSTFLSKEDPALAKLLQEPLTLALNGKNEELQAWLQSQGEEPSHATSHAPWERRLLYFILCVLIVLAVAAALAAL